MTTILGIDAAWTATEPSGIALLQQHEKRWRCVAVAPSYAAFSAQAHGSVADWSKLEKGSIPDVANLLRTASMLTGEPVSLVAIDMPVATDAIVGRRFADQAVSRLFGAHWCSAHSPNQIRPGALGAELSRRFMDEGFPIATASTEAGAMPRLLEVYPHPALLTLLNRDQRLPYKVSKSSRYWPGESVPQRIANLLLEFANIQYGLTRHIDDIPISLPQPEEVKTLAALKPYEDALDALICCWVGAEYLAGNAYPLGDKSAAVWCPGMLQKWSAPQPEVASSPESIAPTDTA
jgi:predicted RNase H-like nuclease